MELVTAWIGTIPSFAAPFLLATIGLIINERAGVMNLGVEGIMAVAAVTAVIINLGGGDPLLAVLGGIGAGIVITALFAFMAVVLRVDQVLAGLVTFALGIGVSGYLGDSVENQSINGISPLPAAWFHLLPKALAGLLDQDLLTYAAFAAAIAVWFFIDRTTPGLRLRAVGEDAPAADAAGISVFWVRIGAVLTGGAFCALAGTHLSLVDSHLWVDNMVAGRGWIAVAMVVGGASAPTLPLKIARLFANRAKRHNIRAMSGFTPRVKAVLGPTNTGKTHLAIERLLGHSSGIIGFPLRLLARENYDRMVARKGIRNVALITGEEKIVPPGAKWFSCTVEAMPLDRKVEFVAVDEIQLCADPDRGHVFTDRLLHARGMVETMFLGAETIRKLLKRLIPDAEIETRPRLSELTYAGPVKLSRLPPRSAVVAFSAAEVYAIAEAVRRRRGGCAVVMGRLSPRTRNAQVALYQEKEVDFLVATDAIGMGLNMDVDHVGFAGLSKFDGHRPRMLQATEMAQIAGRAGRGMRDGTFGVTADCPPLGEELVTAVETHAFEPLEQLCWRNSALDFSSVNALLDSLMAPPAQPGLVRGQDATDLLTLAALHNDADIARRRRAGRRHGCSGRPARSRISGNWRRMRM